MPVTSRWSIPLPEISLPTFVFGSPDQPLSDKLALIDATRPDTHFLSAQEFRSWAKRVAVGLQKAGLQRGDRVMLFSGNCLFYPIVFMGILMAGGVFTGANPTYVARELAHQLKDSGAKFLLTTDVSIDTALDAASEIGMSRDNIFIFNDDLYDGKGKSQKGLQYWDKLIASQAQGDKFAWEEPENAKETIACLNYSSGTTGVAKGVMITHYNHIANASQMMFLATLHPEYEERLKVERFLAFLPFYHAYGQAYFCVIGPSKGIPIFIMPKFDFVQMLEHVQRFKITTFVLVPPVAVALSKYADVSKYDLSSITSVGSGAAPLSRAVSADVEKLWPDGTINFKQGWGMTETTCSALGWDPNLHSDSFGVGEPNANCEARVMNADGTGEVAQGERGELWVRGPNIMKGYWKNEKATAETITPDGWLKTGDICYIDSNGTFFIVDRLKELIKVKGLQVAPAELEAILLEHPKVADAGVVGVTINGEECPRAYIALREGAKVSEVEVAGFLETKVSRHKRLAGGVVFVDAIPKNPSGKILRKFLRERAKAEVGDQDPKESKL